MVSGNEDFIRMDKPSQTQCLNEFHVIISQPRGECFSDRECHSWVLFLGVCLHEKAVWSETQTGILVLGAMSGGMVGQIP